MRKLLYTITAAALTWIGITVASPAVANAADVYTTPGTHNSAGRQWNTQCEHYAGTITRCRTDIQTPTGWAFNNLTYFGGTQQDWAGNPLATNGTFTSGGREWKTSCADEWTGPNGCRTFVKQDGQWVFNNVIAFRDPATAAPAPTATKIKPLPAPKASTTASTTAEPAKRTGKNWTITTVGTANSQRDIDSCKGPMLWKGRQHVATHNYCNNWAANAWHDMKAGDTLTLTANGETINATYSHDFSVAYGQTPPASAGKPGGDTIWVQVSWPDEIHHDTNHVIVFTKN